MGEVKRAVKALDVVDVDLGESNGLLLADDAAHLAAVGPWVTLLPALDPTPMGYVQRDWFLGPHGPALFDRSGNIGPTVWSDGRIVGGWAQQTLEDWLGNVRITPRFRTPLERELSA
jgi:hypothetical protein